MRFSKEKAETTDDPGDYSSFSETASQSTLNKLFSTGTQVSAASRNEDPLAEPPSGAPPPSNPIAFRGFSTSISDMFANPEQERVDCCSLTCCGVLQSDRDRYLLTGVAPPSPVKRLIMHVGIPVTLFFAAGIGAMRIHQVSLNQMVSTTLILALVVYFWLQCAKGRAKRMEVRKDLLFTKYQMQQEKRNLYGERINRSNYTRIVEMMDTDRPRFDERHESADILVGQTRQDIKSAHPFCLGSCYAEDRPEVYTSRDDNICAIMYELICPDFCGRHCQLCGLCAIAQEARDIETCILPAPYRRVDYITMEPIMKYYPAVYRHKHQEQLNDKNATPAPDDDDISIHSIIEENTDGKILGHPVSRLTTRLMHSLYLIVALMFMWSLAGPLFWKLVAGHAMRRTFGIPNFFLLLLVFAQAFGFLALWSYIVNRPMQSRLSMDAIVKFFASGFFLSASLAIFWELLASLVLDTFVSLVLAATGIIAVGDQETEMMTFSVRSSSSYLTSISGSPLLVWSVDDVTAAIGKPNYVEVFGFDHPIIYTIYLFIATFVVAGFIEEMCKYFGYRMVEHPDFFSQRDLEDAKILMSNREREEDENEDSSSRQTFSKQNQSVQARGAAITLAMVSVALGFTCCENLMYIFLYAGKSFSLELGVLIERSFFPVHPILAAIQSIGVCQRELEGVRATKLGRIVFPAVMLHGAFDFLIVFVSFVGKLVGQRYNEGDFTISNAAEFFSLLMCAGVMALSIYYLSTESVKQRERLAAIDQLVNVDKSSLL